MSSKIFRIFNPGEAKKDPVEKRREQLRSAQRSYRDRKDKYTRSLEQEVERAQNREAQLMIRCEQLYAALESLTEMLSRHEIGIPASFGGNSISKNDIGMHNAIPPGTAEPWTEMGAVDYSTAPGIEPNGVRTIARSSFQVKPQRVADVVADDHKQAADALSHHHSTENDNSGMQWLKTNRAVAMPDCDDNRMCEVDLIAAGMEFVLRLESPCLEHIHGDPKKPDDSTGHVLTVSAQTLSLQTDPAQLNIKGPAGPPSYQGAPRDILERILALSPHVCFDGEMTPAQAWEYIRSQPHFGGIELRRLWALVDRLIEGIKCHGFGAVIETQSFQTLVYDALLLGMQF
ncbi:hypothetical protein BDP55DRAFT_112184 [Colletotrichum godetiae]|uniref:BZIP domain-containing protein n=1 Tax=Colletotrichum godetiae TaxID=1209918 RepID=A0AAJ0APR1_9PEZI|nr:uncharacterized protein BDP55DRAFT_112184 [Colletotrichum godetiae]KAK1676277.1 hypothetical protein BDP55DRAFT_112184 [Colletotrichum godetiae]